MEIAKTTSRIAPIAVLYGPEGRGKTTLASKFRNTVFIDLEHGVPRGVIVDAIQNVANFPQVMAALRDLYKSPGTYQTLVVDSLDRLEAWIVDAVCAEHRWATIESPSFGKGWIAADVVWRQFLRAVSALRDKHGMTIVLIAHSAIERVEDPRAPAFTSYNLRLHRRARALVLDAADVVGFLADDLRVFTEELGFSRERTRAAASPTRYLFVEGTPAFCAKNRYGLPPKIEITRDFSAQTLTQYFEASTPEGEGKLP